MKELTVYRENTFERLTRLGGLFVLAPLLLLLTIPVAIQIAQKPELGFSVHRLQVFQVLPAGPASGAGLLQGDRVLAVNGRAVASMSEYYAAVSGNFSHAPVSLTVARGFQDLTVVVQPVRPSQATLIKSYSLWVAGLAFLMIGWWVLLRRVDPVARNFFSLCFGFAFFLLDVPDIDYVAYMTAKEYLRNLLQFMLPAFFLRFFLLFPGAAVREPVAAGPCGCSCFPDCCCSSSRPDTNCSECLSAAAPKWCWKQSLWSTCSATSSPDW